MLPRFWLANYLFVNDEELTGLTGQYTYSDADLDCAANPNQPEWQSILNVEGEPTEATTSVDWRPSPATSWGSARGGDGLAEDLGVRVEPGGTSFIDLVPEADLQGDLDLSIEIDDPGHIDKYRFSTVAYHRDSTEPGISSGLPGVPSFPVSRCWTRWRLRRAFVLQVQIDEACRTATLAITNTDPNSE